MASSSSAAANNIAVNGTVENGTLYWGARGAAAIAAVTSTQHGGSNSLQVTGRTANWHGTTFNVGVLTAGNEYQVSVWVKLAAGTPDTTLKLTGKLVDDADTSTYLEYATIASATVSANSWTQLSGSYIPNGSTNFENFIVESGEASGLSSYASFYVDDFVVTGSVDVPEPTTGGLKEIPLDMPLGAAVEPTGQFGVLSDATRTNVVRSEFDQVTAGNAMKMRYMYSSGTTFSFTNADAFYNWTQSNGLDLHAHTLVWHPYYQQPDWVRTPDANFKTNFRNHISTVAAHFAGKVVSWDVVNEALYDSNDNPDNLPSANGYRQSVFYQQFGGPSYIDEAFTLARQADPNALLYYNDFNTEMGASNAKLQALVALIQRLLDNNVPIDGVGFQMHVLPDYPSISAMKESWQAILNLDPNLKVKLTELDVRINNIYDGNTGNDVTSCTDATALATQKARYKAIVQAYLDTVPPARRGGITLWGVNDPDSWFATLTRSDGVTVPGCPLLFDAAFEKKPAYYGFQEALQAEY